MEIAHSVGKGSRECLVCGYRGEMKTWLANYSAPQLIFILLAFFTMFVGGLIFLAVYWGKFKCPKCGALNKSKPYSPLSQDLDEHLNQKQCPYCAETIKKEAVICRYCGKDIITNGSQPIS